MIDLFYILQVKFFICFLIYILEKFIFKYLEGKDIIKKIYNTIKYDKEHSIFIIYLLFSIEIHTITFLKSRIIKIYYSNDLISSVKIDNENNISNVNKIILSFVYLDQYHFINILQIYNCGVIYHSTKLFTHTYNYLGNRRIEESVI